jgi:hypothetical protein
VVAGYEGVSSVKGFGWAHHPGRWLTLEKLVLSSVGLWAFER